MEQYTKRNYSEKFESNIVDLKKPRDIYKENMYFDVNGEVAKRKSNIMFSKDPAIRLKGSDKPFDDEFFYEKMNVNDEFFKIFEQQLTIEGMIVT